MRDSKRNGDDSGLSRRSVLASTGTALGAGAVIPEVGLAQDESPVEAGVDAGIDILADEFGVELTEEQREQAIESGREAAEEHPEASDEAVFASVAGSTVGTFQAELPENPQAEEPPELEPPDEPAELQAAEEPDGGEGANDDGFELQRLTRRHRIRTQDQIHATIYGCVDGALALRDQRTVISLYVICWSTCFGTSWWFVVIRPRFLQPICRGTVTGTVRGKPPQPDPPGCWWCCPWTCCWSVCRRVIRVGITDVDVIEQLCLSTGERTMTLVVDGELVELDEIRQTTDQELLVTFDEDVEASLSVADQAADGQTLVVDQASATVPYVVTVHGSEERARSEPFAADEEASDLELTLDPPLEEDTSLEVSVVATGEDEDDEEELLVEGAPDEAVEEEPADEDEVDEDEVDDEDPVVERGTIEYEVQPELPEIDVREAEPIEEEDAVEDEDGDAVQGEEDADEDDDLGEIEVTFEYDNPNEDPLEVGSEFVEGTTDDEPPTELEPGEHTFTVRWTPADADERLVWEVDPTEDEEVLIAETEPAGEIYPDEPGEFTVEIVETNDPVESGETLEVDATVENVGDEAETVEVELTVDEVEADDESVTLEPEEPETVQLTHETTDLEPGEHTATVTIDDDSDETTFTIEEVAEAAEFTVEIDETNDPLEPGTTLTVDASVENVGGEEDTQEVELTVDGAASDAATVTLGAEESESVQLDHDTAGMEPDQYPITVSSEDDTAETTITIEEPEEEDLPEEEPEEEDLPEEEPEEDDLPEEEPEEEDPPEEEPEEDDLPEEEPEEEDPPEEEPEEEDPPEEEPGEEELVG
ncbi:CARDB domain-containing protein [Natronococcus sp. A-GB1]|uniref:COG1470 family protein n=1 Tax=Natronococcus sp. A-GB1 TaxID=3037648 RepID=UPI00241C11F5|nr:CARDB domain-containing protein [Natronococcus sp. A-GB1]MDG5760659.1 CARDB domain-containing protein [Natronococcus sp. A-GB1]